MRGDDEAMARVGHMLVSGYGIKQDAAEAAKWLREAWAIQNYREPGLGPSALWQEPAVHAVQPTTSSESVLAVQPTTGSESFFVEDALPGRGVQCALRAAVAATNSCSDSLKLMHDHHIVHSKLQKSQHRSQQQQQQQAEQHCSQAGYSHTSMPTSAPLHLTDQVCNDLGLAVQDGDFSDEPLTEDPDSEDADAEQRPRPSIHRLYSLLDFQELSTHSEDPLFVEPRALSDSSVLLGR